MAGKVKHRDGSKRQLHDMIASVCGCSRQSVFDWDKEGQLQYRIYRYLADKYYLGKHNNGKAKRSE